MFLLILLLNLVSGFLNSPNNQSSTAPSHTDPSHPAPSPPAPSRPSPSRPAPSQDKTTTTKHPLKIASKNTKKSSGAKNNKITSQTKEATTKILSYLRRILKIQSQQQKQLKSIQLQMGSQKLKEVVTSKTPKSPTIVIETDGRDE